MNTWPELEFGEWLGDELEERGWIQQDLADRIGIDSSTVSRWIAGHTTPRGKTCDRIAEALGIDRNEVRRRARRPEIAPRHLAEEELDQGRDNLAEAVEEMRDSMRLAAERIAGLEEMLKQLLQERHNTEE